MEVGREFEPGILCSLMTPFFGKERTRGENGMFHMCHNWYVCICIHMGLALCIPK